MIKYILSGILALSLLLIGLHLSKTELKIEQDIKLVIALTILEDDNIQLFYKTSDNPTFSEANSLKQKVKGSKSIQTLFFDLEEGKNYTGIRLDLGDNKDQQPILIKAFGIKLNEEVEGFLNIKNDLSANEYLSQNENTFVPHTLNEKYDPFIITNDNFVTIIDILDKQQERTYSLSGIVLSSIFSLALFVFLLQIKIPTADKSFDNAPYIIVFIIIISLPSLGNLFGLNINNDNLEKRTMADKPELELSPEFHSQFEAYYNDNFGFRNFLVEQSALLKLNLFNSYPKLDKVQGGKDGYLFYNDITEHIYPSYAHKDRFSKEQFGKKYKRLKEQKDFLDAKNIDFILAILPNKSTIYPEKLAWNMQSQISREASLASQYSEYFKDKDIEIWNVTDDLLKQKPKYNLYQKLDSHWNSFGAYFAYKSILERYKPILEISPYNLDDFKIRLDTIHEGDLSKMVGIKQVNTFWDLEPSFVLKKEQQKYSTEITEGKKVTRTRNPNAPSDKKLLVFRDSFTTKLIPFFSASFREVVYVSGDFDKDRLNAELPDVVMVLKVERLIKFF